LILPGECIPKAKRSMYPRALLLLPESPYPPRCGNALRDVQQIYLLRQMGFDVCLALMMRRHDLTLEEELQALGGITARYAGAQNGFRESRPAILWRKASYVLGSKRNAFAWWAEHAKPAIFLTRAAAEVDPAVVVMRSLFVHLVPELRRVFAGLVIVDCHDADVHLAEEMVKTISGLRKLGPWANLQAVRRAMHSYLRLADEVWAVSDKDADRIRGDTPAARVVVVPSGLEQVPDPRVRPGDDRLVLNVANYGYGPNASGVTWLLTNVWPALRENIGDVQLDLVGGRMPERLRRLASATLGVRIHGMVPNLNSFYEHAGVVAVPIFEGSGTRLKVVDAWRHGKAVVTTTKGVEGLPMSEGALVVADTTSEFAEAVGILLHDRERRHEMCLKALETFRCSLSFEVISEHVKRWSTLANPERVQAVMPRDA
jgi:hypothetical protein